VHAASDGCADTGLRETAEHLLQAEQRYGQDCCSGSFGAR